MTSKEFIKLIKKAKVDDNGNLYLKDDEYGRKYFGIIQTVCSNFAEEYYCEHDDEYYDRHFTSNDDTLIINLVKNKNKGVVKK